MVEDTGPDAPRTLGGSLSLSLAVSLTAIATSQIYEFLARYLTAAESYLGALIVPGIALLLLLAASHWEGRPLRDFGFILTAPWTATITFAREGAEERDCFRPEDGLGPELRGTI